MRLPRIHLQGSKVPSPPCSPYSWCLFSSLTIPQLLTATLLWSKEFFSMHLRSLSPIACCSSPLTSPRFSLYSLSKSSATQPETLCFCLSKLLSRSWGLPTLCPLGLSTLLSSPSPTTSPPRPPFCTQELPNKLVFVPQLWGTRWGT